MKCYEAFVKENKGKNNKPIVGKKVFEQHFFVIL